MLHIKLLIKQLKMITMKQVLSLIKGLTLLLICQLHKMQLELYLTATRDENSSSGVGNILMEINTDGNFNVFGDFIALSKLSIQKFWHLRKRFDLSQEELYYGMVIHWISIEFTNHCEVLVEQMKLYRKSRLNKYNGSKN